MTIYVRDHINSIKEKTHRTISKNTEEASNKIQHPFLIKTLNKEYKKGYAQKCTANNIFNGQRLRAFPLRLGARQDKDTTFSTSTSYWRF